VILVATPESFERINQSNRGSKSNNLETNARPEDLALMQVMMTPQTQKVEATDEQINDAVVYNGEVTSIDFMMPEEERAILEQNLNVYGDVKQMQKVLNAAKRNKLISEEIKSLELIGKTGDVSSRLFDMMMDPKNLATLEKYLQRKFEEGDIAKAYKEVGLTAKLMLDAREAMQNKMKAGKSGKTAKIALKFTNDNGEDFQLGAEVDV
jgi:hypothetical protein